MIFLACLMSWSFLFHDESGKFSAGSTMKGMSSESSCNKGTYLFPGTSVNFMNSSIVSRSSIRWDSPWNSGIWVYRVWYPMSSVNCCCFYFGDHEPIVVVDCLHRFRTVINIDVVIVWFENRVMELVWLCWCVVFSAALTTNMDLMLCWIASASVQCRRYGRIPRYLPKL